MFVIDGRRVAIECRTFTSERLLRLHGLDQPNGKLFQAYVPLEPHIWLAEAIAAKEPKVAEYKKRADAESVWLVVHSARGNFSHLTSLFDNGFSDLFHIGAWQTPHSFERIYITGEYDLPPVCIYDRAEFVAKNEHFLKKRVLLIPVKLHLFGVSMATEGPNGEGQITLNLGQSEQKQFLLQPLDKRFRVDYSPITSRPSEEVALSSDLSMLYANPATEQ